MNRILILVYVNFQYPSRCAIDEGVLPAHYANKVQIHQAGRPYGMLSLSILHYFQYYNQIGLDTFYFGKLFFICRGRPEIIPRRQ